MKQGFLLIVLGCLMFSVHASKEFIDFNRIDKHSHLNSIELRPVTERELPYPYKFLLTQPLMTAGLEKFYSSTPIVQVLHANRNTKAATYSRIVIMNIVNNGDDASVVQSYKIPVELALITMNLKQLPTDLLSDVMNSNVPFGKLLLQHNLKVYSREFQFYSLKCTNQLAQLIQCPLNKTIYARKNYLYREDNKQWVANVLEILSGHDKGCFETSQKYAPIQHKRDQ